ncbi:metalloregulator ArsR/SmtB family transcription factor [Thalassotalea sp. G2M2-11]|uniref:metalloregulator ArsR/SmtB family transcription factor n=1 Tax=Thalassotalea sp. G2M2-11 TaxID=2787627 RepID=UPI0019D2054A|nr:metalloregulator ArsR/SmtB family transcription factor [Thalassotalea sp. G2M2-11]
MKVLFFSTANSDSSAMAKALLQYHGANNYDVYSADIMPNKVDDLTLLAIEQFGLPTDGLCATHIDDIASDYFDVVIALDNNAANACDGRIKSRHFLTWDIEKPRDRSGSNALEKTLQALNERITLFLCEQDQQYSSSISPTTFYKALADEIRLKTLLIIAIEKEVCVCELMIALDEQSQPKVSRHLAQLKKVGILSDRKYQQWVFYSINPMLPKWMKQTITSTVVNEPIFIEQELARLTAMGDRPTRISNCCN